MKNSIGAPKGGASSSPVGNSSDDSHRRDYRPKGASVRTGLSEQSGIDESNASLGMDNSGRGQTPVRKPKQRIKTDRGTFVCR